jgi:hypothetical protein
MTWGIATEKFADESCALCTHPRGRHPGDGKCLEELCNCLAFQAEEPPLDPVVKPPFDPTP